MTPVASAPGWPFARGTPVGGVAALKGRERPAKAEGTGLLLPLAPMGWRMARVGS